MIKRSYLLFGLIIVLAAFALILSAFVVMRQSRRLSPSSGSLWENPL